MTKKAPVTAATQALDRLGIAYTAHPYEHDPFVQGYGLEAARQLDADPGRVFKTLVVETDDGGLAVAVIPVSAMLDLRRLAAALGAKRAAMAQPTLVERRTGYVVGGISPVGQRTVLPLVLDDGALRETTIYVSGGRRGFDLQLDPHDLLTATGGTTAAIAIPK